MGEIESLIFLLGAAVLLAQLARYAGVPYPVFLVLGGLAIGFTPGLPTVEVSPEVIFLVFLPPLLNSEAFSFSPLDLRARLHSITLLAVGLENLPLLPPIHAPSESFRSRKRASLRLARGGRFPEYRPTHRPSDHGGDQDAQLRRVHQRRNIRES